MAINKVDYPSTLSEQADFSAHGELIETRFLDQSYDPLQVVSGNIPQGVVFQVGGVVYRADSDTAVSGATSDYVKITPDGATATAAYATDLTGVSWSKQYNGYYDGSGNLYIFDEGKALAAGEIASVFGRYLAQQANGDVQVGNDLKVAGTVNTGHGNNELYPMNQGVKTNDAVTFSTVNARGMDTFGGFYRGSARDATSLPVGSIVAASTGGIAAPDRNEAMNVYTESGSTTTYILNPQFSSAQLSGVWRSRGRCSDAHYLMQRVS